MGGWHMRMTWGQEVFYDSFQWTPASALSLPTVWSLWGSLGMARCWEMSTLPAGYMSDIGKQQWITGFHCVWSVVGWLIVCIPRWQLSLSRPIQSDQLLIADQMIPPSGREHSHGKTQYIPGEQVLVLKVSRLWKIYFHLCFPRNANFRAKNKGQPKHSVH